ncbi:hypothetical protein HOP50_01g05890 [Chloropicon primus]|uniref:Uncharacterized protein n=1 Tax=Chloropicon primus TaxID=1764295 RepID=A0A5B8MEJ7_9CHLO|nr:hypothetical protein A3770_01p06030 [Chloropicon primus]UPQ97298.1 hypothetical protein HOP50_01g05890 [Chloropicon primus]|eukprot:QDZ18085.1 hypothetical protein A3770_01p06030 [Chloropicon primus]
MSEDVRVPCRASVGGRQARESVSGGKGATTWERRRGVVLGLLAGGLFANPLQAYGGVPPASSLQACLKSLEGALVELQGLRGEVQLRARLSASLGPEISKDVRKKLRGGELGKLAKITALVDDYIIGEGELSELDEAVWQTMMPSSMGRKTVKVPFGPNDFVCAILSCINDPRTVPSTDVVLTKKMLDEGLGMGSVADPRITSEGILGNIDDLSEKLTSYVTLAKSRSGLP